MEKMLITGVARDDHVARISVLGIPDMPGEAFKLFSLLGQSKINVDIILQSIGRNNTKDISFTVADDKLEEALECLRTVYPNVVILSNDDVSKISVVGSGMQSNAGVAAKLFEALYNAGVNINMISTSEIKISVLIARKDADRAVEYIHDAFIQ